MLVHVIPQEFINNEEESRVHLNLHLGFPMHKDELILLLVEADVMGSTTVYQNKFKNRQRSKAWMTQGRIIMDRVSWARSKTTSRFNNCFIPDKGRAPVTFRYTRAGLKVGYHSFKPACAARLCDHVVTSGLPNPASPSG